MDPFNTIAVRLYSQGNKMASKTDHDSVMNDIKKTLDRADTIITDECCIYKVPLDIRTLSEDAYTPRVVSIGPFHHSNSRVQNMQRHKLIYCKNFLDRAQSESNVGLHTLVRYIEDAEPVVRRCYSDTLELTPVELVKVVLVDSCFICELFWKYYYKKWKRNDTLFMKTWLKTSIMIDLLLLENQLPFVVLKDIHTRAFNSSIAAGTVRSFIELTFHFFEDYNTYRIPSANVDMCHFTDLLRIFHLEPLKRLPFKKGRTEASMIHLQSATELSEAGLVFEVNTTSKCLLDWRLKGKVLGIPPLRVEDWTEILFRNLIALEQCHYQDESYFTDYVVVLDFLINNDKDVDVLVGKGILVNWLGDADSVAKLFNSLLKNITFRKMGKHYFDLCRRLDDFCRDTCHRWRATLRRDYGKTPWQAAASIGGIVLLILTLIQAVCSVIQVVQAKK